MPRDEADPRRYAGGSGCDPGPPSSADLKPVIN
jgi:hypothetical protein